MLSLNGDFIFINSFLLNSLCVIITSENLYIDLLIIDAPLAYAKEVTS